MTKEQFETEIKEAREYLDKKFQVGRGGEYTFVFLITGQDKPLKLEYSEVFSNLLSPNVTGYINRLMKKIGLIQGRRN